METECNHIFVKLYSNRASFIKWRKYLEKSSFYLLIYSLFYVFS